MPYQRSSHLAWQLIDGQAVVMDLSAGKTLGLNPAGSLIWELLPDHDEAGMAQVLAERFGIELDAARADVHAFLEEMKARGLVVES